MGRLASSTALPHPASRRETEKNAAHRLTQSSRTFCSRSLKAACGLLVVFPTSSTVAQTAVDSRTAVLTFLSEYHSNSINNATVLGYIYVRRAYFADISLGAAPRTRL